MTIDPIFDVPLETPATSVWQKVKAFWRYLQLTHSSVSERVAVLEKMNGSACAMPKV